MFKYLFGFGQKINNEDLSSEDALMIKTLLEYQDEFV